MFRRLPRKYSQFPLKCWSVSTVIRSLLFSLFPFENALGQVVKCSVSFLLSPTQLITGEAPVSQTYDTRLSGTSGGKTRVSEAPKVMLTDANSKGRGLGYHAANTGVLYSS